MSAQSDRAQRFRDMHREPPILVLPNAWDVESAHVLAALPGCRALATSSGGVARALGWEDGERMPVAEVVAACGRIAAAIDLPVSADLEHGYGDLVATARAAWEVGLVGINFEDSVDGAIIDQAEQSDQIAAIHHAVPELVINARVDVYLRKSGGLDDAVRRASAYLEAGADCAYPIFCPPEDVAGLAEGIAGPVNVLARPGMPGPADLERAGIARLTWGAGLAIAAYAEAARIAGAGLAEAT